MTGLPSRSLRVFSSYKRSGTIAVTGITTVPKMTWGIRYLTTLNSKWKLFVSVTRGGMRLLATVAWIRRYFRVHGAFGQR